MIELICYMQCNEKILQLQFNNFLLNFIEAKWLSFQIAINAIFILKLT